MKQGLDKIDEIFKQTFDGFESDVDPSIWENVQNAINTNTTVSDNSLPQSNNSILKIGGNSIVLKTVAVLTVMTAIVATTVILNRSNSLDDISENTNIIEVKESTENNFQETEKLDQITSAEQIIIEENNEVEGSKLNTKIIEDSFVERASSNDNSINTIEAVSQKTNKNEVLESVVAVDDKSEEKKNEEIIEDKIVSKEKTTTLGIALSTQSGKAPLDVDFSVKGDDEVVSYLWDFGDDSSISDEETPYHTFEEPGLYKVSLTVMDKNAESKTILQFIEVRKNVTSTIEDIPSVFTPNGDGINDVLKISGNNINVFNARVLNLNGKTVFEWNSIDGFWEGKDMYGNLLSEGVYLVKVTVIGEDGEPYIRKQTVTLKK